MALNIPVGISNFTEIRSNNYYYVDKTNLIYELLQSPGTEVIMITRPRRFGKTLAMSMLESFFDIRKASKVLFEGLDIMSHQSLCEEWMNKWPVIFVSFRQVDGLDFDSACAMLSSVIAELFNEHLYLLDDERITEYQRKTFRNIAAGEATQTELKNSLRLLTTLMNLYYDRQVILLIDEYDVPIAKANAGGYYRQMLDMMKGLMQALKDNCALKFAVVTGCLKIAKESIFTGTNNFVSDSVADSRLTEYFGFVQSEVDEILKDADIFNQSENLRKWYDGYHFGDVDVYCPWDVINHVDMLRSNPSAKPQAYWINTSGNALVKLFIEMADKSTRDELERLVAGEAIEKHIRLELTYDEIDSSIDNLWSVLFTTGYLTQKGVTEDGAYKLVIPNQEIREVYKLQIQEWFKKKVFADTEQLQSFWQAFAMGDSEAVELFLNRTLSNSISVFDAKGRDAERENSYHMLLVGLLAGKADRLVRSNVEAGEGFADIIVETDDLDAGVIVELKYAQTMTAMEKSCAKALAQILAKRYADYLHNNGREKVLLYGIAFCKKKCRVMAEKL